MTKLVWGEYTVTQGDNNHVMIAKDGHMVFHCRANEAQTHIDLLEWLYFYKAMAKVAECLEVKEESFKTEYPYAVIASLPDAPKDGDT